MKVFNLTEGSRIYTSNVYLVTGDWNTMSDLNTLIDVGRDPIAIERLEKAPTGVGKHKLDQVFLTHNHYDHSSLLKTIKKSYNPLVFAYSANNEYVDKMLKGGEALQIADRMFEVIHAIGHSSDSICLYCEEERVLFAGDTPLILRVHDHSYDPEFIRTLEYIASKEIQTIYLGHGEPLKKNCNMILQQTLKYLK